MVVRCLQLLTQHRDVATALQASEQRLQALKDKIAAMETKHKSALTASVEKHEALEKKHVRSVGSGTTGFCAVPRAHSCLKCVVCPCVFAEGRRVTREPAVRSVCWSGHVAASDALSAAVVRWSCGAHRSRVEKYVIRKTESGSPYTTRTHTNPSPVPLPRRPVTRHTNHRSTTGTTVQSSHRSSTLPWACTRPASPPHRPCPRG